YFNPKPQFCYCDDADGIVCNIILPANAPIHQIVSSPKPSTKAAKKDACLKACKALHEVGALTDYLLPEQDVKYDKLTEELSDSDGRDEESRALYEMLVPAALRKPWQEVGNSTYFCSYYIEFCPNPVDRTYRGFGLFMKEPLPEEVGKMKVDLCLARGRMVMTQLIPSGTTRFDKDETPRHWWGEETSQAKNYLHLDNGQKSVHDIVNSLVYVPCKEEWREKEEHFIELPPEICQLKVIGFSKDIGSSLSLLPSILHRLESFLVAIELKEKLVASFPEGAEVTAQRAQGYKSKTKSLEEVLRESKKMEAQLIGFDETPCYGTAEFGGLKLLENSHSHHDVKVHALSETSTTKSRTIPKPIRDRPFAHEASEFPNIQSNGYKMNTNGCDADPQGT
ncbi:UNVERIFIED_CONTAM: Endoribonuclease Dicer4, partial [Sesamum radiatum]